MIPCPAHLRARELYLPHQAWLLDTYGACRHDPEGAEPNRANLTGGCFICADFSQADLTGACLIKSKLSGANLTGAILTRAILNGAILNGANLTGAILTGTILDPTSRVPPCSNDELIAAGLTPRRVRGRDRVYGYRTIRSQYVGSHLYAPGRWHQANALSVDASTECHPGIYMGGMQHAPGPGEGRVKVWAYRDELVFISVQKGARCRRVWVCK